MDVSAGDAKAMEEDFVSLRCPALHRLTHEQRHKLWKFLEPVQLNVGSSIFQLGQPPLGMYLVLGGEVALMVQTPRRLAQAMGVRQRGDLFGMGALVDGGLVIDGARAIAPTTALLLTRERFDAALKEVPELAEILRSFGEMLPLAVDFMSALKRTSLFRNALPRLVFQLLHYAQLQTILPGSPEAELVTEGHAAAALYYVVDGELHATRKSENGHVVTDMYFAGDVFGDVALVTGEVEPTTVRVMNRAATLLKVPVAGYSELIGESEALRRETFKWTQLKARATVTLLQTNLPLSNLPAPISVLTDLLAQTLTRDHGDHVLVIRMVRPQAGEHLDHALLPELGSDGVLRLRVPIADTADLGELGVEVVRKLTHWQMEHLHDGNAAPADVHAFLDISEFPENFALYMKPVITQLLLVSRDTFRPGPVPSLEHLPTVYAALIDQPLDHPSDPAFRSATVRMKLTRAQLSSTQSLESAQIDRLGEAARATLSRLGRAMTERRVGIALGGGGAWGYAHVSLIKAIRARGIPIDVVSGASFGSVVGAYYCGDPENGLERVVTDWQKIKRATNLAVLSSKAIAWQIDRALNRQRLEELEVPLLTVATDVSNGTQYFPSVGRIGEGVRASGAFPLMFTPVNTREGRYVDGGMINNVPESVLPTAGAFLVVASNVVAEPTVMPPSPPPRIPVLNFLHDFNPFARVRDMVRSSFIMLHSSGDRQALFADVTFESLQVPYMPWEFDKASEIMKEAEEPAAKAADRVKHRWDRMRHHLT